MEFLIESMKTDDWPAVRLIYQQGIQTGNATFETAAPEWEQWNENHLKTCRLVVRNPEGDVIGWTALSPVSSRCVYGGVAEVSIYISEIGRGLGYGSVLLKALIAASEEAGLWTLQAGILAENEASLRLHQQNGFRLVGRRERIGRLNGVWRDVILLERRSLIAGLNEA